MPQMKPQEELRRKLRELAEAARKESDQLGQIAVQPEAILGLLDALAAAEKRIGAMEGDAGRYAKLRRWMSSNVKEGWQEVEKLAAVACYVDWEAFDKELDQLPECNVGLCQTAAIDSAKGAKT